MSLPPIGTITKAILGGATAAAAAVTAALQDGLITNPEWINIVVATLVAGLTVFSLPNGDGASGLGRYTKAIHGGVLAGSAAFSTAITASGWPLSVNDWVVVGTAILVGSGLVAIAPNAAVSDNPPGPPPA